MELSLKLNIAPLPHQIGYHDNVLLVGSCFTEHISERLSNQKFSVVSNPHGILFNPLSVASSISRYVSAEPYTEADLFYLNELWNSWQHHTRFSHTEAAEALQLMNTALATAHQSIKEGGWCIITLGSAFQYYLNEGNIAVANNHRAPSQWFNKRLLEINTITEALENAIEQLRSLNDNINVILTVSPVRHAREGVVENNRSKARLLESVHTICGQMLRVYYFPAYELVIDILRDYRFYDIDFVHPNYLATSYVWERFHEACLSSAARELAQPIAAITAAYRHRPRFPHTKAHQQFLANNARKCLEIMEQHPEINLTQEYEYFSRS